MFFAHYDHDPVKECNEWPGFGSCLKKRVRKDNPCPGLRFDKNGQTASATCLSHQAHMAKEGFLIRKVVKGVNFV